MSEIPGMRYKKIANLDYQVWYNGEVIGEVCVVRHWAGNWTIRNAKIAGNHFETRRNAALRLYNLWKDKSPLLEEI